MDFLNVIRLMAEPPSFQEGKLLPFDKNQPSSWMDFDACAHRLRRTGSAVKNRWRRMTGAARNSAAEDQEVSLKCCISYKWLEIYLLCEELSSLLREINKNGNLRLEKTHNW